ncbi:amino acid ABC transporter substrate-binding protein [Bordetella genomosp. 9]|uniref:amino acid ABC transporter substrate-binding protein n=1 Tax=Bordetella genomosp. 9 TaxID=1416803 RepID=UPI000A29486B|nr:amino acid ABC transporter substrate-binding protein [Bordetella genomosp. 9]ARP92789.1 amino acid ABC transporter substrate-binding protein [Bordetella genomosp. 9]
MKKTLLFAAIAAATTLASVSAHAGRLDNIKSSGTIALGYRDASLPFSYLDDNQKPIGYSMDICYGIVDAVAKAVGKDKLNVKLVPVTSSTRIPLVANGTVDLECGSTTNNLERQKQVSFAPTTFVTANRFVAKKSSNVKTLEDLKGKTVISTAGTSNIKWVTEANGGQASYLDNKPVPKLGMNIIPAKDHAEAFLTVENGRATAFFMDDVLLAGLVATSRNPKEWMISDQAYSVEPYAMIEPKDDPAFKKVVDDAVVAMIKNGTVEKLYNKWFMSPIPPKNVNLNLPMSPALKKVLANPTDSGDPATYK